MRRFFARLARKFYAPAEYQQLECDICKEDGRGFLSLCTECRAVICPTHEKWHREKCK